MKKNHIIAIGFIILSFLIAAVSGVSFIEKWKPDMIINGPGVTRTAHLSDYFPDLKGEYSDSTILFFRK